jgi:hypothetical protein
MKTTAIVRNGIIEPSDKRVLQEGAHLIIEEDVGSPTISELEKMFPVDIDRELEPLFKQKPQSIDAIQKSIEIASRHFSSDRFFVTIIKDPEHDKLNQLSIIVKTSLDPATAFQKTSDIDAEFLQDSNLSDILIHVEFQ